MKYEEGHGQTSCNRVADKIQSFTIDYLDYVPGIGNGIT